MKGELLAACVLGCSLFQFAYYRYGQASGFEYFFVFHVAVVGFTLLYGTLGGAPLTTGGLVIYALTCLLFWIIKKLDMQDALERGQAASDFGKAAIEDEIPRRN
jgi:hypothetical protein